MCGIAGFLFARRAPENPAEVGRAMAARLHHRGPDSGAVWDDVAAGVVLGHRRLAIVDLSSAGAQPMTSADGRFVLVYNGEVYNAPELRGELETKGSRPFRGYSDTEVIVEACARWGAAATVKRLIGMFAFALWDRREHRLVLARDRMGIKPLYWTVTPAGSFLFGSELKALQVHPHWVGEIDPSALAAYMRFAYVPAPHTIHCGVYKQPPGSLLELSPGDETPCITSFWSLTEAARRGTADPLDLLDDAATDRLETCLTDAVKRRMIADVPLGAFLSGGIDSSTVTALMQASSDRPVRTFSIGFDESGYDEAVHAEAVARHLGTDHTTLVVTPDQALETVPRLSAVWDEPFADASQIPTLLLSELTRRHVTVALSGDGGDELFAGYARHGIAAGLWPRLSRVPRPLRTAAGGAVRLLSPDVWQRLFDRLPARARPFAAGDRLHKLAGLLDQPDEAAVYRYLVSQWQDPNAVVVGAAEVPTPIDDPDAAGVLGGAWERMQLLDMLTYLPDDILTKVDRASMAASLEVRVPLLDHRIVELAWRLPPHVRRRDGIGKWLLRRVLYRHVPPALVERPKQGFAVPLDAWLRGPLRDWAESLLSPDCLNESGLIDAAIVRRTWAEHLSGRRNHQYRLWTVLMFEAWRRESTNAT